MTLQDKPKIVKKIEQIWNGALELYPAPKYPTLLDGLMAFKANYPKYAINEAGQLIGLNLAETDLDNAKWKKIDKLLADEAIQLQALNMSDNKIEELTFSISLINLKFFDVEGNPIINLPKQIVEQGNTAIVNFFRQVEEQEGTVPLYEAKLLIVGEPGAGKTTLLEKLIDPEYITPVEGDPKILSTVGVNIYEGWDFPFREKEGIRFKANLWDFGGQEIQYMTHHFFLTPRALYVLVADDRKQNTEFDYWFRIINLLGYESENEPINVLVVLNEINHQSVTNFSLGKYRKDYPGMNIRMWEVDFSVKDRRSDQLSAQIQEMLCSLPHIGDPLPRLWVPIREDLLEMRKREPHISFSQFREICSKDRAGKRLEKEDDQRVLSGYLHRLGVLLHYQDDDFLDNFVILNPQWAVDAVYSVLKDDRVVKNQGRFTAEDLRGLWRGYSSDERSRLLRLMLKDRFEICYRSPQSEEYIAPQLLPNDRPEFQWDSAGAMKFRYQYPFMPKGLISRLTVRLSDDIAEDGTLVWKEGVVVQRNACRARIIQQKTVKEGLEILEIELTGALHERKFLLRQVMIEVEKIHEKSFRHIAFERMIPCICEHCKNAKQPTFFEYSKLIQYQDAGAEWDQIDCPNVKLKKVSVTALLGGVFHKAEGKDGQSDYHFHLNFDPKFQEGLQGIEQKIGSIKNDTTTILSNQKLQQNYLDTLLIYAEGHRSDLAALFQQIDDMEGDGEALERVNIILGESLNKYLSQLSPTQEIVKKWEEIKQNEPHIPDAKWKLKLKLPFVFGAIEKELSWDSKMTLKMIRREISAFRKGEKRFKELFWEADE